MKSHEARGKSPLLLHLAKLRAWRDRWWGSHAHEVSTAGNNSLTRGLAVASAAPSPEVFTEPERKFMLGLARDTLHSAVSEGRVLPEVCAKDLAPKLRENRACFVTLTKSGELRGCVGQLQPREPLCQAIATSACNAALSDPRFPPVAADEVDNINIEISVLSEMRPLSFTSPEDLLSQLEPNRDGVVLRFGPRTATFLPQVWERVPDKVEFLNSLAEKAGCEPSAWRDKATSVSVYQVESFEEN